MTSDAHSSMVFGQARAGVSCMRGFPCFGSSVPAVQDPSIRQNELNAPITRPRLRYDAWTFTTESVTDPVVQLDKRE